ncbi:uncharacterized protein [Nicotiana sylvestris]|uniref:uncharacterized protein n=1 Tax=Nicotiana sylvestris TaxID=4096 RepID=UPI00388CADC4
MVGERVLLWLSPMKDAMRFGKKGKLSPRFIGPFEILRRVGEVAYELALPPSLAGVHPDLSYVEEPVAILDRQVRKMRSKNIASVRVQWRDQPVEEATWETEQDMHNCYPHLFTTSDLSHIAITFFLENENEANSMDEFALLVPTIIHEFDHDEA